MSRDGLIEQNKATGETENISAKPEVPATGNTQKSGTAGAVVDRVKSEHRAKIKKKATRKANDAIRARQKSEPSRLQFTKEERADPALSKPIAKADKAADRVNKANKKIPTKRTITAQRVFDEPTGKSKTRLSFRETERPPNGKLKHGLDPGRLGEQARFENARTPQRAFSAPTSRPARETSLAVHREISKTEGDNSGVEAAHKSQKAATGAASKVRNGYRSMKLRPYRAAAKAEKQAAKANVNVLYQKALQNKPDAGVVQKAFMKRKIKRDYAKSFRQGNIQTMQKTAATAKKTAQKATQSVQKTVAYVARNWKWLLIVGAVILLFVLLFAGMSSCASMFSGGGTTIIATTYTAEDADILGAEADYSELEAQLQAKIDNTPSDYPGYDEYRYNLSETGHDPFELASYLTVKYNDYTRDMIQAELRSLLSRQYTITYTPITEVRYRTETRTGTTTDAAGNTTTYTYTVQVPYNYYILNVSLVNHSLGAVAAADLIPDQKEMYDLYQETKGNRPLIFGGGSPDVSQSEDLSGVHFVNGTRPGNPAVVAVAETQVGNVGGAPYWSWYGFNSRVEWCACFVSWCYNQKGYSEPVFASCRVGIDWFQSHGQWGNSAYTDIAPGDAIFFDWNNDGIPDHVGLVVGTDGERVYTVEGNSGDACKLKSYPLNYSCIVGYGLMN
jgi:hypothetical protein